MFSLKPATCESVSQYFVCKLIGSYRRQKSLKTYICSWSFKDVGTKSEESNRLTSQSAAGVYSPDFPFHFPRGEWRMGGSWRTWGQRKRAEPRKRKPTISSVVLMCLCMLRLHIISVIKAAVSLQRRDWNSHRVSNKEEIKIIYNRADSHISSSELFLSTSDNKFL